MKIEETWLQSLAADAEAEALTADLVSHRSYPGEEGNVQRAVAAWLERHGLDPELQPTEGDRPNVIATVENGTGPTLLLNGHVDTVLAVAGWSSDPWTARREGDRLYGLGACDMKAGVAAAMIATRALARHRDRWRGTLILATVVDEEAYSIGARALIDAGLRADWCVVTEASWDKPCLGSVGKTLVRVDVVGKAAHASWPETGVNAAVEAARFVAVLDGLPLGRHPRLTATRCVLALHAGNEQYVITVPERARVTVNRMLVPGESGESTVAEMRALAASLGSPATFDFAVEPPFYPPWEIEPDHPLAVAFGHAYAAEAGSAPAWGYTGFGDANLFSGQARIPTVQFGPRGANFHQADEWVDVPSIAATNRVLVRLALALMPPDAGDA
ncbi:MAG: M20 family metallopeptidase [Chloroflexia bacterium]|nr:M20 family metallopeptidase [Chloroflexia bacterium]